MTPTSHALHCRRSVVAGWRLVKSLETKAVSQRNSGSSKLYNMQQRTVKGVETVNLGLWLSRWAYKGHFAGTFIDGTIGEKLEDRDLIKWLDICKHLSTSLATKLGRSVQGIRDVKGANIIYFTSKSYILKDRLREVTYGQVVLAYEPDKLGMDRCRLTVGGDRKVCLFDVSAPTAELPRIKMLLNSVLLVPGATYFSVDISNFYLGTSMERSEDMRLPIKIIPQEIIDN